MPLLLPSMGCGGCGAAAGSGSGSGAVSAVSVGTLTRKSLLRDRTDGSVVRVKPRNAEAATHLVPLTLLDPTAANQLSIGTAPSVPSSSTSARDWVSISATDSDCAALDDQSVTELTS